MINIFHEPEDSSPWSIWHDCDGGEKDGVCIGMGKTRRAALRDALRELTEATNETLKLAFEEMGDGK